MNRSIPQAPLGPKFALRRSGTSTSKVQSWPETGIHNQDPTGFHFQIRDTPNFLFETGYLVHPLDGHATRSTGAANGKSYPGAYKFGGVYNGGKFSDPAGHMSNSNYLIYGMAS